MSPALRRTVIAVALALVVVAAPLVAGSSATTTDSPFYLKPSSTNECASGARNCVAVNGPWVVVPANHEATFLFGCPTRRGYLVGGTDARASSGHIHVWFDGALGTPLGQSRTKAGAVVLFHAVSNNGKAGSFEPIIGCISLKIEGKRSTLSASSANALPGTKPSAPYDFRARTISIQPGGARSIGTSLSCLSDERLAGSWQALAFATSGPPNLGWANAFVIKTNELGDTVQALINKTRSVPVVAEVQIGGECQP